MERIVCISPSSRSRKSTTRISTGFGKRKVTGTVLGFAGPRLRVVPSPSCPTEMSDATDVRTNANRILRQFLPITAPKCAAMIVHRLGLPSVEYRKQWVNHEVLRDRPARQLAQDAA